MASLLYTCISHFELFWRRKNIHLFSILIHALNQGMPKFIIKSFIFVLIVFVSHLFVESMRLSIPVFGEKHGSKLENYADVFLFGSSVEEYADCKDKDKRSISKMIDSLSNKYHVDSVSGNAYQMDLFLQLSKYIAKNLRHPKLIAVPINLRSFSPEWDKRPEYQFEKEKKILNGFTFPEFIEYAYRKQIPFLFSKFHPITQEDFENTIVFDDKRKVGKVKDFLVERENIKDMNKYIKEGFLFHYMYRLEKEHRKLNSMIELSRVLSANHIKVLFYITPVDFSTGEMYFPGRFIKRLKGNTDLINLILINEGNQVLDLSLSLNSNFFSYEARPNEHLNEKGRMYVANKLNENILKLLSQE